MVSVNSFTWMEFVGLYLHLAGFIIGLGAVTVIDLHGFLGRKSPYWTEATTRTHKVTKPLIWLGMTLAIMGAVVFHYQTRLDLFVSSAGSHYVRAHREWGFPFLLRQPVSPPARTRGAGLRALATGNAKEDCHRFCAFLCRVVE